MNDQALFTILQCAEKTDGLVGRGDMAKLLFGQESKRLSKYKFDHLQEYGSLSSMDKKSVLEHIDHLIERGCLSISSMFFPMITITEAGQNRLTRMTTSVQQAQEIPVKMKGSILALSMSVTKKNSGSYFLLTLRWSGIGFYALLPMIG